MGRRKWVRIAPEDMLHMADLERALLATDNKRQRQILREAMWKFAWMMLNPRHKSRKHLLARGGDVLTQIYMEAPDTGLARAFVLGVDGLLNEEKRSDA